jgi:hypothetical protein
MPAPNYDSLRKLNHSHVCPFMRRGAADDLRGTDVPDRIQAIPLAMLSGGALERMFELTEHT